jgi:hypothetical protein
VQIFAARHRREHRSLATSSFDHGKQTATAYQPQASSKQPSDLEIIAPSSTGFSGTACQFGSLGDRQHFGPVAHPIKTGFSAARFFEG